jgi:hypothetical protein
MSPIKSVECFTLAEVTEAISNINSLGEYFVDREVLPGVVFATLGNSSYLDGSAAHGDDVNVINNILHTSMFGFYDKLYKTLSDQLGVPVYTVEDISIPGFQIIQDLQELPIGVPYGGTIHKDKQHNASGFEFDFDNPITFTVLIEAPVNGASLNYWEDEELNEYLPSNRFERLDGNIQQKLLDTVKTFDYKLGELILHDGQTLHQIGNMVPLCPSDKRITLQGHGIQTDKGYLVYF